MADIVPPDKQKEKEQLEKKKFKKKLMDICEPMCFQIMKERPENISSFMINWLLNKYNYSSSLLKNEEKKDLQNLKEDLETFHEFDEHIYYIDLQNRLKKEAKMPEKKSKIPPKPKPRLPPDDIMPSDDDDYEIPEEVDTKLDDKEFLKNYSKPEFRLGTFEVKHPENEEIQIKNTKKPPELFEFIKIGLLKSPMFSELSKDILKKCIDAMEKKTYSNMAEVVKQDEYCDKFFFIEDGELECRMGFIRVTREGNKKKVEKFDPKLVKVYYSGDCFGELNLIYTMPLRGTVKAIKDTTVYTLDRQVYKHILTTSYKEQKTKRIALFKKVPILQTLDDQELDKLVQISKEAVFNNGETVLKENEYNNNLMIIEEGNCIGKQIVEEGKQPKKTNEYKQETFFGEGALLKPEKSQESIIANNDFVRFICVDRYSFKNIFGSLEQLLMRNMELYYQYFPPLPEPPKEEVPPPEEKKDGEIDNIENPQIVEDQNNMQNLETQIILDEESLKDPKIAEIVQKYNKILQEKEEEKLKLNSKIDFLENQIKNQNPGYNLDIKESNKEEVITDNKNIFSSAFINGNIVNNYDFNNSPKILTEKIIYNEEENNKFTILNVNNNAFNNNINDSTNLKNNTLPINNNLNNIFNDNINNNTEKTTPYMIPEDQNNNFINQEKNIYQEQNMNPESYMNNQQNNYPEQNINNPEKNSINPDNNSVRIMPENNNILNPNNNNDRYKNSIVKESLNQGEFVSDSSLNIQNEINQNQTQTQNQNNNAQDNNNENINLQSSGGILQEA